MPRVLCASLGRWVDPAVAYLALCGDAVNTFWLDSGPHATTGMSYLGVASTVKTHFDGPVLDWLREQLAAEDLDTSEAPPGFALGWVGWLGYELGSETMGTVAGPRSRYPDAAWLRVERALAFDHSTGTVTAMAMDDAVAWRAEVLAALDCSGSACLATDLPVATATWVYSDDEYLEMIAASQRAIIEGEAYLLCLTTEARVSVSPDPVATYLALRDSSPSHHGALLRAGSVSLLSSSPEQFLSVSPGGVVTSSPIKGTRPRGDTEADDGLLRHELQMSVKERAENVMIVDLMRNDIGKVSRSGTVGVDRLLAVESYAQVHQLVSTIRGELGPGLTAIDAIESCFPAGSMTGAPKLSATKILGEIEQRSRGLYSGVFGYVGVDGAVDLAMVIRSIVIDGDGATVGTGGGITALSLPQDELAEVKLKAAALLSVLGVRSEPLAVEAPLSAGA